MLRRWPVEAAALTTCWPITVHLGWLETQKVHTGMGQNCVGEVLDGYINTSMRIIYIYIYTYIYILQWQNPNCILNFNFQPIPHHRQSPPSFSKSAGSSCGDRPKLPSPSPMSGVSLLSSQPSARKLKLSEGNKAMTWQKPRSPGVEVVFPCFSHQL